MLRTERYLESVGLLCHYCKEAMEQHCLDLRNDKRPSSDHRVPRARGGSDDPSNIVLCCRRCNVDKGALTEEEYAAVLGGRASRLDILVRERVDFFIKMGIRLSAFRIMTTELVFNFSYQGWQMRPPDLKQYWMRQKMREERERSLKKLFAIK